jgi:hypothetical protein
MMNGERVRQIVVIFAGVLFLAAVYPLTAFFTREPAVAMMMSIYAVLGVFSADGGA